MLDPGFESIFRIQIQEATAYRSNTIRIRNTGLGYMYYLVEVEGLQAEGVQEPGEGALTVVGEYDHLQAGSEKGLVTHQQLLN